VRVRAATDDQAEGDAATALKTPIGRAAHWNDMLAVCCRRARAGRSLTILLIALAGVGGSSTSVANQFVPYVVG
jgi:type IV secretory pathway TrbF-like protein